MDVFSELRQTFSSKKDGDHYLSGLGESEKSFSEHVRKLVLGFTGVNEGSLEDLMIILLEVDISIKTAQKIVDEVESCTMDQKLKSFDEISECLIEVMHELYASVEGEDFHKNEDGPTATLMVGINGGGKMTTTTKLAELFQSEGSSVVLAVADIFRVDTIGRLAKWADCPGVTHIRRREGGDPSAALVGTCRYAKEHGTDCLIGGTAGCLRDKANLVQESSKMCRVIEREIPGASHEAWLILDVTTGQNGISQAQAFLGTMRISGIILTKMGGTAEGGIAIAIRDLLELSVKYVGLGEKGNDLRSFDIGSYLYSLCGDILQYD